MSKIKSIKIHPIFNRASSYIDHPKGELEILGDDLGRDCMVNSLVNNNGSYILSTYQNNGACNTDWFSWCADVLSPINGTVKEVYINPVTNDPGKQNPGRASSIILQTTDGVNITLGHIQKPEVKEGDIVIQGQLIAKVGSDGYSRQPHIHIGAWQAGEPLSIEFDRELMADIKEKVGEEFWFFGTGSKIDKESSK